MLGQRDMGRRVWELLPILCLFLFAAQPRTVSAQTLGSTGTVNTGVPVGGPSAQLFSTASNSLLFSPPPPETASELTPTPPVPIATSAPSERAQASQPPPPPPPNPPPPPPPEDTASPTPSPTPPATPSPTPAPRPPPPRQPSPPPPAATRAADVVSTPGTTSTAGTPPPPTQTQQASPQQTPPAALQSPPPPPVQSPLPPVPSPPPANPSPPPVAPSPPPAAPSPPPATPSPSPSPPPASPSPTPSPASPPPPGRSTPGVLVSGVPVLSPPQLPGGNPPAPSASPPPPAPAALQSPIALSPPPIVVSPPPVAVSPPSIRLSPPPLLVPGPPPVPLSPPPVTASPPPVIPSPPPQASPPPVVQSPPPASIPPTGSPPPAPISIPFSDAIAPSTLPASAPPPLSASNTSDVVLPSTPPRAPPPRVVSSPPVNNAATSTPTQTPNRTATATRTPVPSTPGTTAAAPDASTTPAPTRVPSPEVSSATGTGSISTPGLTPVASNPPSPSPVITGMDLASTPRQQSATAPAPSEGSTGSVPPTQSPASSPPAAATQSDSTVPAAPVQAPASSGGRTPPAPSPTGPTLTSPAPQAANATGAAPAPSLAATQQVVSSGANVPGPAADFTSTPGPAPSVVNVAGVIPPPVAPTPAPIAAEQQIFSPSPAPSVAPTQGALSPFIDPQSQEPLADTPNLQPSGPNLSNLSTLPPASPSISPLAAAEAATSVPGPAPEALQGIAAFADSPSQAPTLAPSPSPQSDQTTSPEPAANFGLSPDLSPNLSPAAKFGPSLDLAAIPAPESAPGFASASSPFNVPDMAPSPGLSSLSTFGSGPAPAPLAANSAPPSGSVAGGSTLSPGPVPAASPQLGAFNGSATAPVPSPTLEQNALAPAPSEGLPIIPIGTESSPAPSPQTGGISPSPSPQVVDHLSPSFTLSPGAQSPGPEAFTPASGDVLAPGVFGPAQAPTDGVAYSDRALSPELESNLVFASGAPLAASPSTPSWLQNSERVGTNLYYSDSPNNTGFFNVLDQPNGSTTTTVAFSTVPAGSNVSTYQQNSVGIGLAGFDIYPFNETFQAALMNQLHIALDNAGIGHTIFYSSTQNNTGAASNSGSVNGRKLLQSNNADNITSTVGQQNQTASLSVQTQDNITVNVVVSVAPADRNNLTAIVDDAISSGQVRRGLLAAGANVTNSVVTGVSAINSGTNSNPTGTTPNNASPTPNSSGSSSGAVIGGAVGGGCAAVILIGFILYRVHIHKMKKHRDLEASPAAKYTDSSSDESSNPYDRNGHRKYPHSSGGTSDSGDRPPFIKTMKGGMQDVVLLSNGYSSVDSPYAHSVQPRDHTSDRTSPDSPGWEAYRQKILTGIEKAATKNSLSHKIDANLWQVQWSDVDLRDEIGGGSYGKVHIAKWRETTVAVKVLANGVIPEDKNIWAPVEHTTLLNLEKEASMMASMRHPNVVMYIGVCLEVPALVTEYCARGSLHDVLRKWKHRPEQVVNWSRRLGMVLDAAKGMNYLHSSDPPVIHRDLKSPNLLVDKHWNVKICDFNLSKAIEESANVMSSLGTTNPRWLAPEILSGKDYTFSSDVYSFGLIMWEMLTWTVPWNEISHWQCVHVVTEQKLRPEVPTEENLPGPEGKKSFSGFAEYVELMQQCWNHEPSSRPKFPHVIEVLRRLMATEAGHRDGRSSSLGTDQQSSSGFLSLGHSTNNQTSLGRGTTHGASLNSSHDGHSLGPSQNNSAVPLEVTQPNVMSETRNANLGSKKFSLLPESQVGVIYETPTSETASEER